MWCIYSFIFEAASHKAQASPKTPYVVEAGLKAPRDPGVPKGMESYGTDEPSWNTEPTVRGPDLNTLQLLTRLNSVVAFLQRHALPQSPAWA